MHKDSRYTAISICSICLLLTVDRLWYNKDDGKGAALRLPGKGGAGMAIRSEAQKKAVAKYNAAKYEQIQLRVEKGKKETIKAFAESRGESLNGFINRAIDEAMQRADK